MKKIILSVCLFSLGLVAKAQVPANDNCANAIDVPIGGIVCTSGTTVNSTFDGTLPSCGGTTNAGNVWYKFTATSSLSKIDITNVSGFDPVLSVYSTCGGSSIECVDAHGSNIGESKTIITVVGTTYLINVKQYSATSSGIFCISVSQGIPPNDNCVDAITLTLDDACTTGSTYNSTFDGALPSCGGINNVGNVWYKFTATSTTSIVTISNVVGFDPVLAVHSTCGASSIECVDANSTNGGETKTFTTVIGTTYLVNVKQYAAEDGTFCISVRNSIPPNDNCANAINLTIGAVCKTGTTVNSTFDGTMPSCGGTTSAGNVWYKFTAAATQSKVEVSNVSGLDAVLAIYDSCGGNSIQCIDGGGINVSESKVFTTVIGKTYLVNVKQYATADGTFCINVTNANPPANNNCANAINLTTDANCTSGTTAYSTFDGVLPTCGGTNNTTAGNVWYKFTATSTKSKIDITSVLGFDAILAIYDSCGGNSISCTDNGSTDSSESKILTSVIGKTYLINVKQYAAAAGTFCIKVQSLLPGNDDCVNATVLTVGDSCKAGTTVNSTFDGAMPLCGSTNSAGNVWYKFTATAMQSKVEVSNVNGFDVVLAIYDSCGSNSIFCADGASTNGSESKLFTSVIGKTYLINVKQYNTTAGTFCINVINANPPANDICVNATNLTVGAACTSGTTVYSTFDGTLPSCGGSNNTTAGNVWYKFTAISSQSIINITNVTGFDAVLAVYDSCGGNSIACADDSSSNKSETKTLTTIAGKTYLVSVKQYSGTSGTFCINVMPIVPANDNCANAIDLTIGSNCTNGTTVNATFDGNMPACGGSRSRGNVWYKFTAQSTQSKIDVTNVLGFDPVLAVYDSCGGNSIACVDDSASNENEMKLFTTVVGKTYLVSVKQYGDSAGTFCIKVSSTTPVNDNCSNATNLTVGNACTAGSTANAVFDGVMPSCGGTSNTGNVWYKFTATSNQSIIDVTNVSGLDAVLAVYDSCGGNSIQCANNTTANGNESITFNTVIGKTYLVSVKKQNSTSGIFCISVNQVNSVSNDNCANAISLTLGAVCTSGTTINSTFDGNMPSCGGTVVSGNVWYKFTATSNQSKIDLTNVAGFNAVVAIYDSCGGVGTSCVDLGVTDSSETITMTTVIGKTYLISVKQKDVNAGNFCIKVTSLPPVNDNCANATALTVGAPCTSGSTTNATFDGNLPSCGGTSNTGNVWYKFTATSTKSKIDISNVVGLDAVLAVYNTCGGNSIACANNNAASGSETILLNTVVGTTYLVSVKKQNSTSGTFCISISDYILPVNDSCANAINITTGAICTTGSTVNSTFDGNLPSCGGTSNTGNVWYKFTATSTKSKIELTNLNGFDAVLAVYNTCGGNSIQCVDNGSKDSSEFKTFTTVVGSTYLINVKQYDGDSGTFCIKVKDILPPTNDSCAHAIHLTANTACTTGTTEASSFDGTMPSCGVANNTGNVWYTFTATSAQSIIEVGNVVGFDPILSVYAAPCGGASVQCVDAHGANNGEKITLTSVAGTTYLINVKQYSASSAGAFCISVKDTLVTITAAIATSRNVVSIYPNPASNYVTIECGFINTTPVEAYILNNLGQIVKTISLRNKTTEISLTDMNSGMYTIQIPTLNSVKRFVKN